MRKDLPMSRNSLFPTSLVGSYTRPSWLLDAYKRYFGGSHASKAFSEISEDHLLQLKNEAKLLTIKEIEDSGLDFVGDGEQGRTSFFEYLSEQISGFELSKSKPFSDGTTFVARRKPVGKLELQGEPTSLKEARFLREHTRKKTKVAVISPNFFGTYWEKGGYYETQDAFMDGMFALSKQEAQALAGQVDLIQWDDPMISLFTEETVPAQKARELTRSCVENVNKIIDSVSFPTDKEKALHLCWGNYKATHQADGPLEKIYPELLNLKVDIFFLEMASARHEDDIEVFREYPDDQKMIGIGVIDVKTPDVEPVRLVRKRAERALKYIDPEKLRLTTDCGFAPEWDSDRIPRTSCYQKLCSMSTAAEELRKVYGG
jgi:5-methyltetrahydropteroyltriglutamate--homocysteine methyltransferase